MHVILVLAYLIFIGLSLNKWFRSSGSKPSLRKRVGSIGLAVGIASSALLSCFYLYIWLYHALLTHGLALWTYFLLGAALSIVGMILGSIGLGYIRQTTLLISFVTFFEWTRELVAGAAARRLIDIMMLIVIGVFGFTLLRHKRYSGPGQIA